MIRRGIGRKRYLVGSLLITRSRQKDCLQVLADLKREREFRGDQLDIPMNPSEGVGHCVV